MQWSLPPVVYQHPSELRYGDSCFWIGSCFSESMANIGKELGFKFESCDFGTLFHPLSIADVFLDAFLENPQAPILEKNGLYYCWSAGTKFCADEKAELQRKYQNELQKILQLVKESKFIFVTFGTSFVYTLNENKQRVANCHKMPGTLFTKSSSDLESMQNAWEKVLNLCQKHNPDLEFVFTVSPVRHTKDGLIENNRSKAKLLLLCEKLSERSKTAYFPSYEIMMDELRDYRFYAEDMIHPNELAQKEIWSRFCAGFMSEQTKQLSLKVRSFQNFFSHRSLASNSNQEVLNSHNKMTLELSDFLNLHSEIIWTKKIDH